MRFFFLLWLLPLTACDDGGAPVFPPDFYWGSATSGFQVDMGCPTWTDDVCVDSQSDWYQWINDPAIVGTESLHVTGEDIRRSPGMWELFEEDVASMAARGLNAYRLSVEWSRVFPEDASAADSIDELDDFANDQAVARYHEFFVVLRAAEITPVVTLNHNTLPLWVHDGVACHADLDACTPSGWVDPEIVDRIALFAGWIAREYGDEVDIWATLNEPTANMLAGYVLPGEDRAAPPGVTLQAEAAIAVLRNQILAHAAMADQVRMNDGGDADEDGRDSEVGIVMNMVAMDPADPMSEADQQSVVHADHLYHRLFLDGLTRGAWDEDLDGIFETTRPELADQLDWLGINYYNRMTADSIAPARPFGDVAPIFDFIPSFPWDPYPEGLERVIAIAREYDVPIWITENGTPHVDESLELIDAHLEALLRAIGAGGDVRGYLYWSWVDNYEWSHGLDMKFGLNEFDPETKTRMPRPVLDRYAEIAEANSLE